MKKKTFVEDPDFGPVEVPLGPSKKQISELQKRIRAGPRGPRRFERGRRYRCDNCGKQTFEGRDDVTLEILRRGTVHVFRNLHGALCTDCGAKTVEGYEMESIDDLLFTSYRTSFGARVTNVGKGAVGTYWPKDVQRHLSLRAGRRLEIEILSPELMLLRVMPAESTELPPDEKISGAA